MLKDFAQKVPLASVISADPVSRELYGITVYMVDREKIRVAMGRGTDPYQLDLAAAVIEERLDAAERLLALV